MQTFLQHYVSSIPLGQRLAVETLILNLAGEGRIRSTAEADSIRRAAEEAFNRGEEYKPSFSFTPFQGSDRLSSVVLNRNMRTLGVDLEGLYAQARAADGTISSNSISLQSDLDPLLQSLKRTVESTAIHRLRKLNTNWDDMRVIAFHSAENRSVARLKASVDPTLGVVHSGLVRRDRLQDRRGPSGARITVESLSDGITTGSRNEFGPKNAIDTSPQSFWAEVIMADEPIQTTYDSTTYDGVIYRVTVDLGRLASVNRVHILPFAEFPVQILDVQIRQGSSWTTVSEAASEASLGIHAFLFSSKEADAIRFHMLQPSYKPIRLLIPEQAIHDQWLWEMALDETIRINFGDQEDGDAQHQAQDIDSRLKGYFSVLDRLSLNLQEVSLGTSPDFAQENLNRVIAASMEAVNIPVDDLIFRRLRGDSPLPTREPKLVEVRKVQYVLGAFDIQILADEYLPISYYATPRLSLGGALLEAAISPDEDHVNIADGALQKRLSAIEYDVEISPGRSRPLLPKDTGIVQDEVVYVDPETRVGFVRFYTADLSPTVRANGVRLSTADFSFDPGNRKLQILRFIRRGEDITITYIPSANQDVLDVKATFDSLPAEPEIFFGTDSEGVITLAFDPYIEYDIINDKASWHYYVETGRWLFRPRQTQVSIDGRVFGLVQSALSSSITSTATSLALTDGSKFTSGRGILKIEDEIIRYDTRTSNTFNDLLRGHEGTLAASHAINSPVLGRGETIYEPISVSVDGAEATNLTDYYAREHPAFTPSRGRIQYIHLGRELIFSNPIPNTSRIEVQYRWTSQYVQVYATFRSIGTTERVHTSQLKQLAVLLNTTRF